MASYKDYPKEMLVLMALTGLRPEELFNYQHIDEAINQINATDTPESDYIHSKSRDELVSQFEQAEALRQELLDEKVKQLMSIRSELGDRDFYLAINDADKRLEEKKKEEFEWRNKIVHQLNEDRKRQRELGIYDETGPVQTKDCSCDTVDNIVLCDEDYCKLLDLLSQKSDLINDIEAKILKDMMEVRRAKTCKCYGYPFAYTTNNYTKLGATYDDMRDLRKKLEELDGVMYHSITARKRGNPYTRYWMNEAKLLDVIEDHIVKMVSERPVKEEFRICHDEVEPLDQELALKAEEFDEITRKDNDLTDGEQAVLYLLNEASTKKANQLRGKRFVCNSNYLASNLSKKYTNDVASIRESLEEKGYITTEHVSWVNGYVYHINKLPDSLKNAS